MHHLEVEILNVFKKLEGKELTTSEIVKYIFPDEAGNFDLDSSDVLFVGGEKKVRTKVRYNKALLHKRLLYHLNKLVKEGILKLSGIEEYGEKRFSLSEDHADMIIEDKKKTIIIRNNHFPSSPIEGYEAQRIIKKLDSNHWINKLDSIVLNANKFENSNKLQEVLTDFFDEVNDSIGILHFEKIIQLKEDNFVNFLENIAEDTKDYNKNISFIIDCDNIYNNTRMLSFIDTFVNIANDNLQIVFELNLDSIKNNKELFIHIINTFSKNKIKINIKNKDLISSPAYFGKAGVYSFDEKEWAIYEKDYQDKTLGASCSSSSLIIDVQEFFNNYHTSHEFREFILKANKTLLIANINKRKIAHQYLRNIHKHNKPYQRDFFLFERNYIRLWNYNFQLFDKKSFLSDLFKSAREESEKFCFSEETIYNACGIPIRFSIVFTSAFRKSDLTMSQRSYIKRTVHDISYFNSPEAKEYLKTREKLNRIFSGIDRVRFFRANFQDVEDIINEFNYVLQNLKFAFFTFDFAKIKGNTKLTAFFDNTSENVSKKNLTNKKKRNKKKMFNKKVIGTNKIGNKK